MIGSIAGARSACSLVICGCHGPQGASNALSDRVKIIVGGSCRAVLAGFHSGGRHKGTYGTLNAVGQWISIMICPLVQAFDTWPLVVRRSECPAWAGNTWRVGVPVVISGQPGAIFTISNVGQRHNCTIGAWETVRQRVGIMICPYVGALDARALVVCWGGSPDLASNAGCGRVQVVIGGGICAV